MAAFILLMSVVLATAAATERSLVPDAPMDLFRLMSGAFQTQSGLPNCAFGGIDLSSLNSNKDYTGTDGTYQYNMNVCGQCNEARCATGSRTILQTKTGTDEQYSLGSFTGSPAPTWSWIDSGNQGLGVALQFTNGDLCYPQGRPITRTVNVQFTCKQGGTTDTTFQVSEDVQSCTFLIILNTPASCPGGPPPPPPHNPAGSGGLGGGSIVLIGVLVVVILYVAVGCVYRRQKAGATNWKEACPQNQFWCALPGLVKDGCKYSFNMIKSGCKSGTSQTYEEL